MKQISSQTPLPQAQPPANEPPALQPHRPDPRVSRVLLSLVLLAAGAALVRTTLVFQPQNLSRGEQPLAQPLGDFQRARISISTSSTDVRLEGGASGLISGTFRGPQTTTLREKRQEDGGTLNLDYQVDHRGGGWLRRTSSEFQAALNARIPLELEVGLASGEARLKLSDVNLQGLDVHSVSGDLDLELPAGTRVPVQLDTTSGEIRVSAQGDAVSTERSGTFQSNSSAGDQNLDLRHTRHQDIEVSAIAGEVTLKVPPVQDAHVQVETVSGDQRVDVPEGFTGELHLTSISGEINLDLPDGVPVEVETSSVSGDVQASGLEQVQGHTYRSHPGQEPQIRVHLGTTSGDMVLQGGR